MKKLLQPVNRIPTITNKTSNSIDLNLYGPVVDAAGWFTDENSVVTPRKVQNALKEAGNVGQINVHVNSPGGSVFAGQAIHNMIRQHPANVTMYIDGVAASIMSVIVMAGNKIIMPPGAYMMIHNPLLTLWGAYFAAEMREMADFLDKIKEGIVATYAGRVTKKTRDEIITIMDATTWMTAADAVEHGFADEVEGSQVTASMSGKVLNIAGMAFDLTAYATLPVIMPAAATKPAAPAAPATENKDEEESILNLEELKAKHPELYNQIFQEGVTAERTRMKALDEVAMPGFEALVDKARYETGDSAEKVSMQIVAAQKAAGAAHLKNRDDDVAASGLLGVKTPPAPDAKDQEQKEIDAAANKIAGYINEGRK